MFDYIARAHSRGWATIVADPHGEECPHRHLQRLFGLLPPQGHLLAVAHSYGAPCTLGFLKAMPDAQKRLKGLALTDGLLFSSPCMNAPTDPYRTHMAPLQTSTDFNRRLHTPYGTPADPRSCCLLCRFVWLAALAGLFSLPHLPPGDSGNLAREQV